MGLVARWLAVAAFSVSLSCGGGGGDVTNPGLTLSAANSTLVVAGGPPYISGQSYAATFTARDQNSALFAGTLSVALSLSGGTSTGTFSAVTNPSTGVYATTFTADRAGTAATVGVTANGSALSLSPPPTIAVAPGPASLASSIVTVSAATIPNGGSATLTLTARDAAGNALSTGGLLVVFTKGAGTSDGTISATTDVGNGTYTATFTGTVAGTGRTIGATIGGAVVTATLPAITVTPVASLLLSAVTVSTPTVPYPGVVTLTLTARDASGIQFTSGGLVVAFTKGSGSSDGTVSATTDAGDGTYTATFTGTTAGTARAIGATIGGAAVTSAAPTVTVTPGPASLSQSTVTVSAPSLVSGGAGTLTLTTRDGGGNARTTGGLVVAFTKGSGTSDGTISPTTDVGNGTYTATFTATTAGTARPIGATIGGSAVTAAAPTITVTPGPVSPAQSTVTVSAASVPSGSIVSLTLTARDAANNALTSGGLTVLFTKGSGASDGTISATADVGNGTYTASFTATTSGSARTIGATIGGAAVTSALPTITVTPVPSLVQSTVTVPAASVASGSSLTLTLTARDASGIQLTSGGLTVVFTKGTGTSDGTISATTDNGNGTYTAAFTASTAGTARAIGATIGGSAVTSTSPTITVTPGPASLSQSLVTVSSSTTTLGAVVTLALTARDGSGNALTTGGLVVAFTKGSGTSNGTISATTDVGNGTYTASFTASDVGTARAIGATIGGSAVTSALPTITVSAGAVSLSLSTVTVSTPTVAYPGAVTLSLTARNASGVQIPAGGLVVAFTKGAGTSDGAISATTDVGDGTYTAIFTSSIAGTARSIGATIGGLAVTSALPTVTVTPGAASVAQSVVSVSSPTVASGAAPVTVTLTARDAGGNALTSGGLTTVVFTKGTGTSDGTFSSTVDAGNGTYTATFTGTTAGTARTIGATIAGVAVSSTLPTVTVTAGPISTVTSTVSTSLASVVVGTTATLQLTAFDAAGNRIATGGATVLFGLGAGTSAGTISPVTDVGGGTYTATFTATTVGTARTITATIGGVAVTSTLPTITVTPPIMGLGSDSVTINAQVLNLAAPQVVSVASILGGSIGGLATTISALPGGPAQCASVDWLGTPAFDMLGVANPVSLMTLQADATALALGTCAREVLVTSTTSGVVTKRLVVVLNVGRAPVASGVVNVVMMGNANSTSSAQDILPIPVLRFDNAGRGVITGLAATVTSTSGFSNCPSFTTLTTGCTPWLLDADLTFSSPSMPSTLSIRSRIFAFGGLATIHVTGTGMAPRDFDITVAFNTESELVTNPRNVVMRAIAGGPSRLDSVMAFNQNSANQGLTSSSYKVNPDSALPPAWLTVAIVQPVGDSAKIRLTANPAGHFAGELLTYRLPLEAAYVSVSFPRTPTRKFFSLPIEFTVEGGLSASLANATLFAPVGTTAASQDILVNHNGAGELGTLQVSVAGGAPWLAAAYVAGATATPATLRLTATPTGLAKGTYATTVTITSGAGATLQTRTIPVKFTVF